MGARISIYVNPMVECSGMPDIETATMIRGVTLTLCSDLAVEHLVGRTLL